MKFFNSENIPAAQNLLQRIAIIAAAFIILISAFFILNYLQLKANPPLESPALEKLYIQLDADPNNAELREQIRALDLLARKAYFTRQWQINFGGYMLLAALVILLMAIKSIRSMTIKYPELPKTSGNSWEMRLLTQKWVALSGIILFISVTALALLTRQEMKTAAFAQPAASMPSASVDYKIPETSDIEKNWPGFRGPWGLGIAHLTTAPQQWDGESVENIIWKSPIPLPGLNSPIMWNDKIFFSGADETTRQVYCYDAQTGNLLWQRDVTGIPGSPAESPKVADDTGYAAPTMTTDGNYVFAIFANGDVVCFDFEGNKIWAKNLGVPENHYGHSSSLIMHRDLLLIQYDHAGKAAVMALQAATGKQEWITPRDMGLSWASPILANTGSHWELILSANPNVVSYNPETGKELWRMECLGGEVGSSPVYGNGFVYAGNEGASLAAIKPGETPEIVWEFNDDLPDAASLLVTPEYLFIPTSYGAMTCLDATTGEKYWLHDFDQGFYSSPILIGDNVYIMDLDGVMQIFKADKEFHPVGSMPLGEETSAIPVVMEERLYLRGSENLYCIGAK